MYRYAAFFSYKRDRLTDDWHRNVRERLTFWIRQELEDPDCEIFFDSRSIETGHQFDQHIHEGLSLSPVLIGMWSPLYFTSPWCVAELNAFKRREDRLNLRRGSLIAPACFHAVRPDLVERMQYRDFRPFATPHAAFWTDARSLDFDEILREFAVEIADKICGAPDHCPSFAEIDMPEIESAEKTRRRRPKIGRPADFAGP